MTARAWWRVGWGMFAVALVGVAAYMASVGWRQASLIAEVAGFFVAAVGLALALAARHSTTPQEHGRIRQQMRDVNAKSVVQDAQVASEESLTQDMRRVTARRGNAQQRALRSWRKGDDDA